ncbi:DUF721 domain-containing protein [Rhodoligotrophos ferricapiens]|uniref:DUF721 domain-containing protein n=1 Tax=Rhodoligotrophos ferricapiens TaxID=3069264 RepID=UPI00315CAD47
MAKPIWKHLEPVTAKIFAHHGFAYGEILACWPEIAGPDLARCSLPERIRWPRARANQSEAAGASAKLSKQGGTLILRVAAGHGLMIQHETPRLIERINSYYGYGAIAKVKLVQDPNLLITPPEAKEAPLPADAVQEVEAHVAEIADDRLRQALKRLGRGILQRRQNAATKP